MAGSLLQDDKLEKKQLCIHRNGLRALQYPTPLADDRSTCLPEQVRAMNGLLLQATVSPGSVSISNQTLLS
jgi:hypothetical protein